ncbi:MAG: hypothetical protein RL688_1284 [Actinomycetota bacterium]
MSYLAFEPERLAAMYTSLQKLSDQLQMVIQRLNFSLLYLPEVHGQLHHCRSLIESQQIVVGNVLKSNLNFSHMVPSPIAMGIRCQLDDWLKRNPGWWAEATHPQPTRIDELLWPIANDPHVAGVLIDETSFLAPLIYGAHDTSNIARLWLSATDPRTTTVHIAGQRIIRLVRAVFEEHDWNDGIAPTWNDLIDQRRIEKEVKDLLGQVIAPWQMQFSGLAHQWNWDAQEGLARLHDVARSRSAALALANGLADSLLLNLRVLPLDQQSRLQRIDDVAFSIGSSTAIFQRAKIDQGEFRASNIATLLALPSQSPIRVPWPLSLAVSQATRSLAQVFDDSDEISKTSAIDKIKSREALATIAYSAVWVSALSQGRINEQTLEPPAEVQLELQHTFDSIINQADKGELSAIIND